MDLIGMPLQHRFLGALNPIGPRFWLTGTVFLTIYLAINLLTEQLDVDRLAITSWSPDNALSLALLIQSITFAPFVFLGAVLVDIFVAGVQHSVFVTVTAEFFLAVVYVGFSLFVRSIIKYRLFQPSLADIPILVIVVISGATLSSLTYITVFYACDALPTHDYFNVLFRFMLGDITGVISVIPTLVLVYLIFLFWMLLSAVYREEVMKGMTCNAALRILAALRIIFFPSAIYKSHSFQLFYTNEKYHNSKNFKQRHDTLYFLVHKYYLSRKFTLRQRVQAAMDHQNYEVQNYDCEYARRVYQSDGLLLWQWFADSRGYTIKLIGTEDNRHEGDLSVILYVDDIRLCRMSFSYLSADVFGLSTGMTMLISRNQTERNPTRAWFDRCFKQNTPQFFCLAAVCGIAVSNEFKALFGIKHDLQIAYEETFDAGFRNSYSALWEKFDAMEIEQHVYMLATPLKLRPLHSLVSSHRARARNRRKYWDDISQSACSCMVNYRKASNSKPVVRDGRDSNRIAGCEEAS